MINLHVRTSYHVCLRRFTLQFNALNRPDHMLVDCSKDAIGRPLSHKHTHQNCLAHHPSKLFDANWASCMTTHGLLTLDGHRREDTIADKRKGCSKACLLFKRFKILYFDSLVRALHATTFGGFTSRWPVHSCQLLKHRLRKMASCHFPKGKLHDCGVYHTTRA